MPPSAPSQPSSLESVRLGHVAEDDAEKKRETEVQQQSSAPPFNENNAILSGSSSLYNSGYMSPYGGGMMGAGMYGGGAGIYGAGGMGMYGTMAGLGGPMSGLNHFLFGIQNVIFSLSQAVQIIGMNTEAVKHLLESATAMFDHAVARWQELRALEAAHRHTESPEARKRRRRLRALRWALVAGVTYAGYAFVRKLLQWSSGSSRQRRHRLTMEAAATPTSPSTYHSYAPLYGSNSSDYPSAGVSSPYGMGYGYS